ncbi:MAG: YbhN family protein [Acidobacteria bacterium]|nr:YbhN family protein [Acidobacteriota bacterium]
MSWSCPRSRDSTTREPRTPGSARWPTRASGNGWGWRRPDGPEPWPAPRNLSVVPAATIFDAIGSVAEDIGSFFTSLAEVDLPFLLAGMAIFIAYLSMRALALLNTLKAAYPHEPIAYRQIWAAYIAAYGFNNVVPARGGDIIKFFLVKTSVPSSTYPAIGAAFVVEVIFDLTMAVPILIFAFSQGVFPAVPDLPDLGGFNLTFIARDPQLTLFVVTGAAVLLLALFAFLSRRVAEFWNNVRQGFTILYDLPRYLREVWLVQFGGWLLRCTAFWLLLEAFGVGGSVRNVLLVLGINAVTALVPFAPGGAGVQQALLVTVFGSAATVAAYSVGQQVAIGFISLAVGFGALFLVFGFRSFGDVRRAGQAHRDAEKAARQRRP